MATPPSAVHRDPATTSDDTWQHRARVSWQDDIKTQILRRNAMELGPAQSIFRSYAALHARVLVLQRREQERVQLEARNTALVARVRELERAAADFSVRSAREMELEAKKDELQERLQRHMEKENEFYKGMAELSSWKERAAVAEARASSAEADLNQRNAELALIKKEYISLREENQIMRTKVSEADMNLLNVKTANAKLVQQDKKIKELEAELERLQSAVAGPQAQRPHALNNASTVANDGVEPYRNPEGEEELLVHGDVASNEVSGRGSVDRAPSSAAARAASFFSQYPRKATHVVTDAHQGAILQSCCFGDDSGTTREVFTSGSDKCIRIWSAPGGSGGGGSGGAGNGGSGGSGAEEKKRFSSGGSIALSLHSASHYLLAGCVDKTARLWDTRTLRTLELVGHSEKIVAVSLSATAQHAFTASSDSTVKLWDIRTRATLKTLLCQSTANDLTVAGESIFSCHYNGSLLCWDRRTANKSCEVPKAHQRIATCVRITNDGRLCVSLGKDNAISVRDTRVMTRELRNMQPSQLAVSLNWSRLALSPDSKVVAVGSSRGQVVCCVLEKGNEADIARNCPYFMNNFSPLPSAAGSRDTPSSFTNAQDDGVMNVLEHGGHDRESPVPCVAWGREPYSALVSIGEDRRLVMWQ